MKRATDFTPLTLQTRETPPPSLLVRPARGANLVQLHALHRGGIRPAQRLRSRIPASPVMLCSACCRILGLSRIFCSFELEARDKLQRSDFFEHFPEFVAGPARDCSGPRPLGAGGGPPRALLESARGLPADSIHWLCPAYRRAKVAKESGKSPNFRLTPPRPSRHARFYETGRRSWSEP